MSTIDRILRGISLFGLVTTLQIALAPLRRAAALVRDARPGLWGPLRWLAVLTRLRQRPSLPVPLGAFTQPGRTLSYTVAGQTVAVACDNATIHITVLAADLLRVYVQRQGESLDTFSYAVARPDEEWPATAFTVRETDAAIDVCTARLICCVARPSSRITFIDAQSGAELTGETEAAGWQGQEVACSLRLAAGEHVYGLGEKAFGLDRRGNVYEMWNDDPNGAYEPGRDPLYLSFPFYIGLHDQAAYGVFFDNTYRAQVDAGSSGDELTFRATGGPLRYYFFAGPQISTVVERYSELTGRMRMPPLWALGYQQSRWSYTPASQVREIALGLRTHRIPCDAIHLDIHYMRGYRCFTWHPQRFPDPAGLVSDLHSQGFKVVPLIDCGVKCDPSYTVCKDGLAQGVFCAFPGGETWRGPVWPGDCYFPDFTSPHVRAWWGRQYQPLLAVGVDGAWNDMNEPTVFGPVSATLPDCVRHDWDGRGADHARAHNVYGMQMARASAEGLQALRPDKRTFVISRAGWAGLQRYAMNWMGDNVSSWEHLRLTVPMIANLGLCGLAFTGPDTGGFAGDCTPELLARWLQLGVFTPFLRNHSALSTANQEPWIHGEPYESINRRSIELRYHLLPYIYTAFWQCAQTGLPMLRPLVLGWQCDPRTHTLDDEFMFGDSLLIAPVGEAGASQREVYLPQGVWYDWWTGQRYAGAQTVTVAAPLERIPIFARAGSIVPGWPVMQHTGERPVDVLMLHVFPGDGESALYEDDGESLAYQQGMCRVTHFSTRASQDMLTIERKSEGPFAPAYAHVELVLHGIAQDAVRGIAADGQAVTGWVFDEAAHALHCRAPLAEGYQFTWHAIAG